jgi:uncharacterized protein YjbI with pentapeptide repeats
MPAQVESRMNLYANRLLVEENAVRGRLEDCGIENCDLSGLEYSGVQWKKIMLRDVYANYSVFQDASLEDCSLSRCGLTRAAFRNSFMRNTVLDGLVLIRSSWLDGKLQGAAIRSCCMQRVEMRRMRVVSSSFTDFEAIESLLEDCVFVGTRFTINYGNGMNGFSGARLKNCIFYNCRFEGLPLLGADIENCLFPGSSGETGQESFSLFLSSPVPLLCGGQASAIVKRFKEETMREEEIKSILEDMNPAVVLEALALLLAEGGEPPRGAEKEIPGFSSFAQALLYLKKNYDFEELPFFTSEADLVYVEVSGRRMLLTDPQAAGRFPMREEPAAAVAGKTPGRFSNLEM